MSYLPEPYSHSESKIKVELDLSITQQNSNLQGGLSSVKLYFAKKTDLTKQK